MKIEIGESAGRPLLSATLKIKTLNKLADRIGFNELYGRLVQSPDIRIDRQQYAETFTLQAKKIGRRPAEAHESRLKPFVRLLEWGCIGQEKQHHTDRIFRLNEIDTEPSLNGSFRIESALTWPLRKDKIVSEIASTAMQNFGQQIRYGNYRRSGVFDREVYTWLNRTPPREEDDPELRNLTIHTAAGLKENMRVNSEMKNRGICVEVSGNYIRSHKEQLIHLVGAVAVAQADSIDKDWPIC